MEKAETTQRKINVRKRFLSNNLRAYILSDSSLTSEVGGGEFIRDDEMTSSTSDFCEKDPENDSGHEDDTVFLMENPETAGWEEHKPNPKTEQENPIIGSITGTTVDEGEITVYLCLFIYY